MTIAAKRGYAPEIIVAGGCLIALITFGPRASAGLFQIAFGLAGGRLLVSPREFPANVYP